MRSVNLRNPRSLLITGASSGIGEALARRYATPGVNLALTALDADALEAVAEACRSKGARAQTEVLEITDASAVKDWVEGIDAAHPLDLVITSAGISGGQARDSGKEALLEADRVMRINFGGTCNTVNPAISAMRRRGRGQIALMSSLSALRGLPHAPAYCASKAALKAYGEALGARLRRDGIEVAVIMPGFVDTTLTRQIDGPKPLQMTAERAARIIARGLARGRRSIIFPFSLRVGIRLLSMVPTAFADRFLAGIKVRINPRQ